MDGLVFLVGLLLFLVIVIAPILALVAFNRTGRLRWQLEQLQQQIKELQESVADKPASAATVPVQPVQPVQPPPISASPLPEPAVASVSAWEPRITPEPSQEFPVAAAEVMPAAKIAAKAAQPQPSTRWPAADAAPAALSGLFSWLLKGNPLAKLGILLLFFGLAYLMKYSIERDMFPIELRLMSATAISLVLLGLGWRLRLKQQVYALILQGGSVGALYITVFGAFQLYHLLPQLLAFGLMLVICAASVGLAVLQRALSLAVLASLGGYLAPLLLSSGSNNYLGLFSYYLLISCGILGVSVWQSWRVLNLLGFVFTFGVGTLWGIEHYTPANYLGIQLFLSANLIVFGILTLLFAVRHSQQQQAAIDGTLLFGTPLVGFGIQFAITEHWEFGPAFSAIAFGLVYLLLAGWVLRRYPAMGRRMAISCLALGASFATLAIPLALSAQWTAVAWSLEGVGILWAGLVQGQRRMSWSGCGVLLLAAGAVTVALFDGMSNAAFLLSFALLALCWMGGGALWHRYPLAQSHALLLSRVLLCGGVIAWLWLLIGGAERLWSRDVSIMVLAALMGMTLSAWAWHFAGKRLAWPLLGKAVWLMLPFALGMLVGQVIDEGHPLSAGIWSLSWLALFVSAVLLLKDSDWLGLSSRWLAGLHLGLFWLALLWLAAEILWYGNSLPWGYVNLSWALILASMAAVIFAVWLATRYRRWPLTQFGQLYWQLALLPLLPGLLLLLLGTNLLNGLIPGMRYLPLLNPLEQSAMFALLMLAFWRHYAMSAVGIPWLAALRPASTWLLWGLAAWWANGILLRTLSYYGDLPWSVWALWNSRLIQTTLALVWTLAALVMMISSTRRVGRPLWFCGAAQLGVVIIKLFLVDSARGGGLARAIAFIGVAVLVLVVGYFAPLPPRRGLEKETQV